MQMHCMRVCVCVCMCVCVCVCVCVFDGLGGMRVGVCFFVLGQCSMNVACT